MRRAPSTMLRMVAPRIKSEGRLSPVNGRGVPTAAGGSVGDHDVGAEEEAEAAVAGGDNVALRVAHVGAAFGAAAAEEDADHRLALAGGQRHGDRRGLSAAHAGEPGHLAAAHPDAGHLGGDVVVDLEGVVGRLDRCRREQRGEDGG